MKLTQQEKRIKIAEACGYTHYGCVGCACSPCVCRQYLTPGDDPEVVNDVPDYFTDLNAVHEAEKTLKKGPVKYGGQWRDYENNLWVVTNGLLHFDKATSDQFSNWVSATATQRAEAFGLTLNLWTAEQ